MDESHVIHGKSHVTNPN
jgi:hypothetical protein